MRAKWFPYVVIFVLLAVLTGGTINNLVRNPQPRLVSDGIPHAPVHSALSSEPYDDMVRHALADLDSLTLPSGGTLAGENGPWRYVWPRDASFVAVARCAIGQY